VKLCSKIFAVGVLSASLVTSAHAVDFPTTYSSSGGNSAFGWGALGGWYLRGDMGGHWPTVSSADTGATTGVPSSNKISSSLTAGGGFGYKAGFLRVDLTGDYAFPADYKGTTVSSNDTTARIQMTTAMANLYVDLGTWGGLTPYVGAGAGAGFARSTQFARTLPAYTGSSAMLQTQFAYAGMAGLALTVAPNLQLDLGYRYVNYGSVKIASDSFGDVMLRKVDAHEVRLGLRWSFEDLPQRY
jgi:opacity protein-like surface antigen